MLLSCGLLVLIIDVAWGLWTLERKAILIGVAALAAILSGIKILNYSFTRYPK